MDQQLKVRNRINPNEYGGLMIDTAELNAVQDVLLNEKIFRYSGKSETKSDKFETAAREFFGQQFALGLNNGTSALKAALFAIGLKKGDRVLISAYTFIATAASVIALGGIPIPIDFDFEYGMNLDDVRGEIAKGCRAIIPVHLQGRAFDLRPLVEIAHEKGIQVVEDACQAFGATCDGIFAGTFGDIGVFSFQQNKLLTCGEGGLIVTNNPYYYTQARNHADHGGVRDGWPSWDKEGASIGDNYRINNIQAAILIEQLKKFEVMKLRQTESRNLLMQSFLSAGFTAIHESQDPIGDTGMNILFLAKTPESADKAIEYAKEFKVEIRYLWHKLYYNFKVMKEAGFDPDSLGKAVCPTAEDVSLRLVSLSLPPILSARDLQELEKVMLEIKNLGYIT